MAVPDQLPQLPLMLAGVPRPVAELLREAGIPTAPLPKVALSAGGTGRFVLYDSRCVTSALRAKRAKRQGLETIDLISFAPALEIEPAAPWLVGERGSAALQATAARRFLEQLKLELETRGGVWLRLADYPFPYQSAFCLAVEHRSEELQEFGEIDAAFPGKATHFVDSRLSAAGLDLLVNAGVQDLGWLVGSEAFEFSPKKTLSQWSRRLEPFQAAGLAIRGLAFEERGGALPPRGSLRDLGFMYAAHQSAYVACHAEPSVRGMRQSSWIHFGSVPLKSPSRQASPFGGGLLRPLRGLASMLKSSNPETQHWVDEAHVLGPETERGMASVSQKSEWMTDWVREHYQSGRPLFIRESTARLNLLQELRCLSGNAARCSLLWHTTFGEFASWWKMRRQMELQVWRSDEGYEIHGTGDFSAFPWSIEIWRGNHSATLPLKESVLRLRDDGLVFQKADNRSPAGLTVPSESMLEPATSSTKERISAT